MEKTITLHPHEDSGVTYDREVLVTEKSIIIFKLDRSDSRPYGLCLDGTNFWYKTSEARQTDFALIVQTKSGGWNMLEGIKKYVDSNRDLIYTVAFVAIIDQLLFEGAFRERLKALIEGFLKKAEAQNAAV